MLLLFCSWFRGSVCSIEFSLCFNRSPPTRHLTGSVVLCVAPRWRPYHRSTSWYYESRSGCQMPTPWLFCAQNRQSFLWVWCQRKGVLWPYHALALHRAQNGSHSEWEDSTHQTLPSTFVLVYCWQNQHWLVLSVCVGVCFCLEFSKAMVTYWSIGDASECPALLGKSQCVSSGMCHTLVPHVVHTRWAVVHTSDARTATRRALARALARTEIEPTWVGTIFKAVEHLSIDVQK